MVPSVRLAIEGVLAVLMILGMHRLPFALYTPIDGEWAKWDVEAILKFEKVLDLSPYSILAGMGSMYFPNGPDNTCRIRDGLDNKALGL